jgi:phosphotransferase system  glucose/maltose/N-acetylglucosamine-specific IIC component
MKPTTVLAGQLSTLGDSWLGTLSRWADLALPTLLAVVVVVTVARRMSMRAAVGSLIMLAIALGLYWSRYDLASKFQDEVDNPGTPTVSTTTPSTGSLGPMDRPLTLASPNDAPRSGGAS